jgi:hypothetical protein
MKLDYLNNNHTKNKKEIVSVGLLGISAVMVVLIAIKVTAFIAAPARAQNSVKKAVALSKLDNEEADKYLAKSKEIADQLKKNNLFAPPPPKQHPVNKDQVLGILGGEVLINGRWYKAGDNVGDAKIIAIEPTQVRIEWDGKEQTFLPIDAKVASSSDSRKPGGPGPSQEARSGEQGQPESVQVQLEIRDPEGMGRFGGEGGDFRERMMRMRERFENMSPEEREQARAEMRERFGSRGPRGEGGPGGRRGGRGRGD